MTVRRPSRAADHRSRRGRRRASTRPSTEDSLSRDARVRYVDRTLLDLDSARWLFRGFAVVFYLLGALLAFVLRGAVVRALDVGLRERPPLARGAGVDRDVDPAPPRRPARRALPRLRVRDRARGRAPIGGLVRARPRSWRASRRWSSCMRSRCCSPLVVAAIWRPPADEELPAALDRARTSCASIASPSGRSPGSGSRSQWLLNWDRFPFRPRLVTARA